MKRHQPVAGRKRTNAFLSVWPLGVSSLTLLKGRDSGLLLQSIKYALPKSSFVLTPSPIFIFLRFLRGPSASSTLISLVCVCVCVSRVVQRCGDFGKGQEVAFSSVLFSFPFCVTRRLVLLQNKTDATVVHRKFFIRADG